MQHNIRDITIVDKVKDIIVAHDCPMSPLVKDSVYIDGKEWDRVIDFVDAGGDLKMGMLHLFCQNIPFQKMFRDDDTRIHFEGFEGKQHASMVECFGYLREELKPYDDETIETLIQFVNAQESMHSKEACHIFQLVQPFVGRTRAIVLVRTWLNHLLYHSEYDVTTESLLRSLQVIK